MKNRILLSIGLICSFMGMNIQEGMGQDSFDFNNTGCATPAVAAGDCSVALGESAEAGTSTNPNGYSFGLRPKAFASESVAIGRDVVTSSATYGNIIIGTSATGQFTNAIPNSMMLGMTASYPTVFVGASGGSFTYGNVGIGNVTAPASLLHVRDQIRVGLTSGANGSLVFNNSASNTITFNTPTSMSTQTYTLPTIIGSTGDVLMLDNVVSGQGELLWTSPGAITDAWMLAGNGGTTAGTDYLGTSDGVDLVFKTNATERMRITTGSQGNVGIGTQTPAQKLHVVAKTVDYTVDGTGNERIARFGVEDNSNAFFQIWNKSAVDDQFAPSFYGITSTEDDEGLDFRATLLATSLDAGTAPVMCFTSRYYNIGGTIHTRPLFQWKNNTTSKMLMDANGNLGIGQDAPIAPLHVGDASSSSSNDIIIEKSSSGTAKLQFFADQTTDEFANIYFDSNEDFTIQNTADDQDIIFSAKDGGTQTEQMRIDGSTSRVGIGTTTPDGTLEVNGTVFITSFAAPGGDSQDHDIGVDIGTNQLIDFSLSSANFKNNITDIEFDKEAFLNLRPVNYDWREACGGGSDVGLIAQEVNEVFPVLATKGLKRTYLDNGDMIRDSLGIPVVDSSQTEVRGVRYHKLPVYLLAIAKDQQQELAELRNHVQELTERLNGCCASVTPMNRLSNEPTQQAQIKEQIEEFILLQNDPNPFGDYTDIKYEHDKCVSCEIIISDTSGKILKRVKTSGAKGTVRIYASEIGTGMFLYSLVKDGLTVRSERMVSSNR